MGGTFVSGTNLTKQNQIREERKEQENIVVESPTKKYIDFSGSEVTQWKQKQFQFPTTTESTRNGIQQISVPNQSVKTAVTPLISKDSHEPLVSQPVSLHQSQSPVASNYDKVVHQQRSAVKVKNQSMMVSVKQHYMTPDLLSLAQSQQDPLTQIADASET